MVQRRIPLTVYRPAKAGVYSFAVLGAFEAASRSVIISVFPILLYRSLETAEAVSVAYLAAGLLSLLVALLTPYLAQVIPRRWLYTLSVFLMIASNAFAIVYGAKAAVFALVGNAAALVMMTVCFNAYVMDYVERTSLGRNESMRLVFSGAAWAIGPVLGVVMMDIWPEGPFFLAILFCFGLLGFFWHLRLGDGRVITRSRAKTASPLRYIPRFFSQPLLVSGWLFSVVRSVGWQVYIVYLPIFALERGLGEQAGGLMLSLSNSLLFLAPLMLKLLVSRSVRFAIRVGFGFCGLLFVAAWIAGALDGSLLAVFAVVLLFVSTLFLVILDVAGGLPFLMSVKPSERTEMAAVYSTFRDVSAVVTPGVAWVVLLVFPLEVVFCICGISLIACWAVAGRLNPRLGQKRLAVQA